MNKNQRNRIQKSNGRRSESLTDDFEVFSSYDFSKDPFYGNIFKKFRKQVQTLSNETKSIDYHGKNTDRMRYFMVPFLWKLLINQFVNSKFPKKSSYETKVTYKACTFNSCINLCTTVFGRNQISLMKKYKIIYITLYVKCANLGCNITTIFSGKAFL